MILLVLAVIGLCFGSFVNAFVWRLHEGRDWVKERSECTRCHHQLAAKDLVPVVSWLLLKGKCRYCHKPIPDSPLVELAVPILFLLSYYFWPLQLHGVGLLQFILWLVFLIGFVILAVYDLRWYLLPDKVVFPLIALAALQVLIVAGATSSLKYVLAAVVSAALLAGLFAAIYAVSKGKWLGFGDVKLVIALGFLAADPLKALLLLLVASLSGTLIALVLFVQGKASRKTKLPFGPLLLLGSIVAQLFGSSILHWYLGLIMA